MATRSTTVPVTTTAVKVVTGADTDSSRAFRDVLIKNTGATQARIGGSDVTASNGFPLEAGEMMSMSQVQVGDLPYAITASGTTTLAILESQV